MSKRNKLKEEISKKKEILENAKVQLKKEFFGIDAVIDKFVSAVESWYVFPELRTKPLVVNLWGITGVGKTAMVRRFVQLIKKQESYIELTESEADMYYLSSVIDDSGFHSDTHGIILLDEFQKLKTKNEKQEEIEAAAVVDLWTFLGDGSFPMPYNFKSRIDYLISDIEDQWASSEKSTEKKSKKKKIPPYLATRMFNIAKSVDPSVKFDAIMQLTNEDAFKYAEQLKVKASSYENKVFSKLLIIVSGNLDEAFHFAQDVDDADIDADFMNEISTEIKLTDIKQALLVRFRPEQISRLGNIHIIYPVLGRNAYEKIIQKNIDEILSKYNEHLECNFKVDNSLFDAIYRNGVFPNQGVRPVFSTISMFLENPMSYFGSRIITMSDEKDFTLHFDKDKKSVILKEDKDAYQVLECKIDNALDDIRENVTKDDLVNTSIHEAGHAVVSAVLFNVAPRQILSKGSSTSAAGFCTSIQNTSGSYDQLLSNVCVSLAGRAAEELVFGTNKITQGISGDIKNATLEAMNINIYSGLGKTLALWDGLAGLMRYEDRDIECEEIINLQYDRAKQILRSNKKFLAAIADELIEKSEINAKRFEEIASEHGYNLNKLESSTDPVKEKYSEMYDKFKKGLSSLFGRFAK